jgi:hypothetical protein
MIRSPSPNSMTALPAASVRVTVPPGLAAPGGAEQREELAFGYGDVHVPHGGDRLGVGPELLDHVAQFDRGRACAVRSAVGGAGGGRLSQLLLAH